MSEQMQLSTPPSGPAGRLKRRPRSFLGWVGFTITVVILSTMLSGTLVYRTAFLRLPVVAETLCGEGRRIGFSITTYIADTGVEVPDKQVVCVNAAGKISGANLAMLKLWLVCSLLIGLVLHGLLAWRAHWELSRIGR